MLHQSFGILSGILAFLFYCGIMRSILRGETRPSLTSWIIWAANDTLIFASSLVLGVRTSLWVPAVYCTLGWICVVLCMRGNTIQFRPLDYVCFAGSLLGWILWGVTSNAEFGLILSVAVNTIGAVPTLLKVYRHPKSESRSPWLLVTLSSVANILAVEVWEFSHYLFPVNSLLVSASITVLIFRPDGKSSDSPN